VLLRGGGPAQPMAPDTMKPNENPAADELARKQTFAMIDRFMQHDAEIAGVSREGSRQLFYETGLLPRHVALPQWLQTGSAHFFNRPLGPVLTPTEEGGTVMTVALTTGYGRPNFVMQRHFRDMPNRKELTTDNDKLLRNVLTDAYFQALTDGYELDAPPSAAKARATAEQTAEEAAAERAKQEERMALKAQATAWALFYYLYREKPDQFRKYSEELAKLPRDLPLDGRAAVAVFARAFDLTTGPDPEPGKTTLKEFADAWVTAVNGTTPAGVDVTVKEAQPMPPNPHPGDNPKPAPRPVRDT
jgi:hypothetical protein